MENEMIMNFGELQVHQIEMVQGHVVFRAYEEVKASAVKLAEQIKTLEVSEDNVKLSKKLLAEVNKRVKELEDRRIIIKKAMLEPYQAFEEQVKEIVGIVKDADAIVRDQVKQMEEKEREEKEKVLWDLWHKRIQQYSFKDFVQFMDFAQPRHLNKSVSIDAVEKEMVQFLEKVEKDLGVIYQMPEVDNHINAYLNTFDLAQAMVIVKQEQERKQKVHQAMMKQPNIKKVGFLVSIQVESEKELKLLEMILKEHDFDYSTDKVEM